MVRRRFHYAFALAASVALIPVLAGTPAFAIPGGAQPVLPQGSKPPSEVAVVPAPGQSTHPRDVITVAGVTGFLHQHDVSADELWTRYDTGTTTVVHDLDGVIGIQYAGGDTFYTTAPVPSHPASGKISVFNLATGDWQQWPVPTGAHFLAVYGTSTMLVTAVQDGVNVFQLVTFSPDGTATATRTVTGVPATAVLPSGIAPTTNGTSAVVQYHTDNAGYLYALLDIASATATTIPSSNGQTMTIRMSGDKVASYQASTSTVHVYSISGLVSGSDRTSRDVALPSTGYRVLLAGDHVIANAFDGTDTERPALDLPIAGGASTTLLPLVGTGGTTLAQMSDGTALVVGGSKVADWAVHRFTVADNGALKDQAVFSKPDPLTSAGLSLNHGLLRIAQSGALQIVDPAYVVREVPVAPDAADGAPSTTSVMLQPSADSCAAGVRCVRVADGDTHGFVYLGSNSTTTAVYTYKNGTTRLSVEVPAGGGRLVDAAAGYLVVAAASNNTQYLVDLNGPDGPAVTALGAVTPVALWYQTLWTATSTAGQLRATDLSHSVADRTVTTGATCVPTDLQATGRWLYWSCGAGRPAGVYNLSAGGAVALPTITGPALLGDGYLVWHDAAAGALEMVDFHDQQPIPGNVTVVPAPIATTATTVVKLANLPAGPVADDRGITWTVDKFGGDVAYVAADQSVHLLDAGVPRSPITVGEVKAEVVATAAQLAPSFNPVVRLSRPVSSWTLTVTRNIGGAQAFSASGGAARSIIQTGWNARTPDGKPAMDGAYTWHLTVTPTGGSATAIGTGAVRVTCGKPSLRAYTCEGSVAILAVKSGATGEAHWYLQRDGQALSDLGSGRTWPLGSSGSGTFDAFVPFGDFDGDYRSDLLARDGSGVLHAYLGDAGNPYSFNRNNTASSVTIGTGWQGYTLVSTGDVNRDGTDDILARDLSGNLWLYPNTGKLSVGSRVLIGSGWNIYSRLIGTGDLNGDGIGDLLAIDAAGAMWRYYGTSTGGYAPRVLIGSGWNMYNAVLGVGDLNLDGRNDLLARDSAGNLWQYLGDGSGGFAPRTQHGYGFQVFAQIF